MLKMDLNNLTSIGKSWVGSVCHKVEGIILEMDAVMKQNKLNNGTEQGQVTCKMMKSSCAEVTDEFCLPSGAPVLLANVDEKPIQLENLPVNTEDSSANFISSVASFEDRYAQVNISPLNFVDTSVRNHFEKLEAELSAPVKNTSTPESSGPIAESQSTDLACESHLATPIPEEPLEGDESRKCEEINSTLAENMGAIISDNATDEESSVSDLKSIPSNEKGLLDACECIQLTDGDSEEALGSGAKFFAARSIHRNKELILFSHDTDCATISDNSPVTFSEEERRKIEFERSNNTPVLQTICGSLENLSGKNASADIMFCVKEHDQGSSSMLPPSILSATDDLDYDLLGLEMEAVDLSDEVEDLGGNTDMINNNELHALCLKIQNARSFKKKLRDAFAPNMRLIKDYKHLGIWYGDVDIRLTEENQPTPYTPVSFFSSDPKNLQEHDLLENDWVLL
ncbi:hypothetical protein SAY86_004424 [Trapa natans]|uniref:Uncharacterized protein n=1 Tax=Trapa natans TaxID=22666 RepID=A0AAN7MV80_TRANT|nr:hypothetical protein SAY86_004424 [Trapa natans]